MILSHDAPGGSRPRAPQGRAGQGGCRLMAVQGRFLGLAVPCACCAILYSGESGTASTSTAPARVFRGTPPLPDSIEPLLRFALSTANQWLPTFMSVIFDGKSAAEAQEGVNRPKPPISKELLDEILGDEDSENQAA